MLCHIRIMRIIDVEVNPELTGEEDERSEIYDKIYAELRAVVENMELNDDEFVYDYYAAGE